ncbi:outer membrane lipoprotein-sorting protein [Orenia metallireducens]|uniref:Outer membrane lipoprotein-sorting protein n=1 Tax=Orenia metallireducens TaxID=1413210 RepID=A0A285HJH7_9FIRM|nr:outer membrane lipoprotein-sorting protein [Orenia metallireducens]PRX26638.1 outer membrane lipoprotein-sorting protein [Orenia metallireducens]SNY35763.1 Outer membrane lipoprotein-sorting protein [Orenia metallireducens]
MRRISIVVLIVILALTSQAFAMTGRDVMDKAKDIINDGDSMHALMGMDLIDDNGEVQARKIEVWGITYNQAKDLSKVVMEFRTPASIKGTRFLQVENDGRDDDKWIYLPSLGRVRRISSSEGSKSFVGSDFTYDDMSSREVDEDSHKILREEKLGDYDCYVVESIPKNSKDAQYAKRISWVTKEHFVPVRVEMYSKKTGNLQKLLTVKHNIKKIDGIWTVFDALMKDMESGHSTKLYIIRGKSGAPYIEYNKKISPARFTKRFLKTGR